MMNLLQGDCLELLQDIPTGSVDMVLCDLPYGTTQNAWDTPLDLAKLWEQYNRVVKPNGAVCLFAQMPFAITLGASNIKHLRYQWVCKKCNPTGFLNAKKMPLKSHELVLVFYRTLPTYNPQWWYSTPYGKKYSGERMSTNYGKYMRRYETNNTAGQRYPIDVIEYNNRADINCKVLHPTQKAVSLCEYFVKTYTNEGETVLDNCMGSGSTGVACLRNNRNFIGIEKDEAYFALAQKRLTQQASSLLSSIEASGA